MSSTPPISQTLKKKLLKEGWEGELTFTAIHQNLTLGGWLVEKALKDDTHLALLKEALQAGLPFYHPLDETLYVDDLLSVAIEHHFNRKVWDILFEEGLNIDQRLQINQTMLMLCCKSAPGALEQDELFQYLWSKKPNIHLKDSLGRTLLLRLATEIPFSVPWLLEHGADAKDTLIEPQSGTVYQNVFSFILGSFWDCALFSHDKEEIEELLQVVLDHGADLHAIIEFDKTLLQCAHLWCPEAIPFLIDHGVDLEHRDRDGNTILDLCQKNIRSMNDADEERLKTLYQGYAQKIVEKMKEPLTRLPFSSSSPSPMKRI